MYQQGYSMEQITQALNFYQSQLMNMPNPPRTFQEQQAIQGCKAEIQKWTNLYNQAMNQQQRMMYQQPQYQAPMQPQPVQPVLYQQPIQPVGQPFSQQPMIPSTTISNGNNVTGRYSSKKSVQESLQQSQQVLQPVVMQSKPIQEVVVEKPVEFYISKDDTKSMLDSISISLENETRSVEDIEAIIKKMYDQRVMPDKKDPVRVGLDRLLTDIFNNLAKNFLSKSLTVDSFITDYSSIEEYMDKLELVKDQKELDKVLNYIFDMLEEATVMKEDENNFYIDVPIHFIIVKSYDTFKNLKDIMLGKNEVTLNEDMKEELEEILHKYEGIDVGVLVVDNGVFNTNYYLIRSSKKVTVHTV